VPGLRAKPEKTLMRVLAEDPGGTTKVVVASRADESGSGRILAVRYAETGVPSPGNPKRPVTTAISMVTL
jgi:hypothetical protein